MQLFKEIAKMESISAIALNAHFFAAPIPPSNFYGKESESGKISLKRDPPKYNGVKINHYFLSGNENFTKNYEIQILCWITRYEIGYANPHTTYLYDLQAAVEAKEIWNQHL